MRADVGDSLVVKGATNGDPDQRGIITECAHGRARRPTWFAGSYRPPGTSVSGADSIVITAALQQAADERPRSRGGHGLDMLAFFGRR